MERPSALEEMRSRGSKYPGGACGMWGCCGAAVSTGMFVSIVTKATPLTGKSWRLSNQMTARALDALAELGGPRCCKRNCFTAVKEAVGFAKENLGVEMELPEQIRCGFSADAAQCLKAGGVAYKSVDVSADPQLFDGIRRFTHYTHFPQLFVDGRFVGGSDSVHKLAMKKQL